MIQASTELINLLNSSDQFLMADLFTFTLLNGTVLRCTSLDSDLTVNGATFSSAIPIKRDSVSIKAGLEVDELSLTIYPSSSDLVAGVPFVHAVNMGMFDGADFILERAFFGPDWQTCVGSIIRFVGRVSDIEDFNRTEVPMTVKSTLELLNVKMPRTVYQAGCSHTLYDSGCSLGKSSYGVGSSVLAGSTTTSLVCGLTQAGAVSGTLSGYGMGTGDSSATSFTKNLSVIPTSVTAVRVNGVPVAAGKWSYLVVNQQVTVMLSNVPASGSSVTADIAYSQSGYFDLGTVTFTSGLNSGVSRTVKSAAPGVVNFSLPLPYPPATGDMFTIYPGCDKIQSTCGAKFNNLSHFSGCPYIPAAETAY